MQDAFQIVKDFKKLNKTKPIILMGYYNMIYQYGENNFLKDCKKSRRLWNYLCRFTMARK